jgi:Rad3-related DNA helicase
MKVPSPGEIGLPAKFDSWRPNQEEALRRLLLSQKRVKALSAPTGFGKTAVYMAYAILTGKPTCFVTDSRALQVQLMKDFEDVGLVNIWGRRNYVCDMKPDYTCEEGYATRCPYKGTVACPASQAEMRAASSSLVVTNYDKWTAARKFGQGMSHFQQVVFDEGHEAPAALARAMQVVLGDREIDKLGLTFPDRESAQEMVNWKPWAANARSLAEEEALAWRTRIQDAAAKPAWVKEYLHLRNLARRLAILATASPENWVVDEVEQGFQFDPVRPGRYSEGTLLLRVPSIVVVSATLRPKTLFMIGLGKGTFEFQEFDSDFDPKRCPIYYIPTMRVDIRASDLSMLWVRLDQIAARRQDRKGIVHTISYARRDEILARSRFAPQMLINPKGEAATAMVNQFKESGPGTILVSPSVGAGFDFPGTDCEWQFVCKIPFPDGRSKILKARQADDPEYGPYQAINKLVQIFGRGMRSRADQCENFIGDMHLDWFLPRYSHLAPRWFHGFYRRVDVAPSPLARL